MWFLSSMFTPVWCPSNVCSGVCVVPEQCVHTCSFQSSVCAPMCGSRAVCAQVLVWFPSSVRLGACVVQEMELRTWECRESALPLTHTPGQFVLTFPSKYSRTGGKAALSGARETILEVVPLLPHAAMMRMPH